MRRALLAAGALLLMAAADDPQAQAQAQTLRQPGAARYFGGLVLRDQSGQNVDLFADLMDGHVVVINAFYAGCRAACPDVMGKLSHLQAQLVVDGLEANFVSITVDPEHDTPERLNLYARALGAAADWHILSGDPATVRQALHRFGLDANPDDPGDHLNILYIANLRTGLWKRVFSLAPLADLETLVQQVEDDRAP